MYYSYLSGSSTSMGFYYTLYVYNITNNTYTKLKDMNITVHMFTGDTKEKAEEI